MDLPTLILIVGTGSSSIATPRIFSRCWPKTSFFTHPIWSNRTPDARLYALILTTVSEVFQDFTYHREIVGDNNWALEFSARVGDLPLKGIDLIRLDDDGLIAELEVFVRPYNGLRALGVAMARRLNSTS